MAEKLDNNRIDTKYREGAGSYGYQNPDSLASRMAAKEKAISGHMMQPRKSNTQQPGESISDNIDQARNGEKNLLDSSIINNTTPTSNVGWKPSKSGIKGLFRRKKGGAAGVLLTLILGGAFGLTALFTPSTLLFHFREVMLEKFNDQLTAMDIRTTHILHSKLKNKVTKGVCTPVTTICKYQSMSPRQVEKLETKSKGRIKVVGDRSSITGRIKVEYLEIEGEKISADNIFKASRTPHIKDALVAGYNPRYAIWADEKLKVLAGKIGLNKGRNIEADSKEKMQEQIHKNSTGEAALEKATGISCTGEGDKRKCTKDGAPIDPDEADKELAKARKGLGIIDKEIEQRKKLSSISKNIAKQSVKSAVTSLALGLGSIDTACGGYLMIRAIGFAAKYLAQLQLARSYFTVMNSIDTARDGDGLPEVMSLYGDKITAENAIGQTATDSSGYRYAAYGDVTPTPSLESLATINTATGDVSVSDEQQQQVDLVNETTRYINGQMVDDNIMTRLIGVITAIAGDTNTDDACHFVKSGWGKGILALGMIAGAIAAFFSGGLSLGAGAIAQLGLSIAIGVAMAMLAPKLYDMAAGTVITGAEEANAFGNSTTSGAGAFNALGSQNRGLGALPVEEAPVYAKTTRSIQNQYIAMDNSHRSPIDVSSKYTALGSVLFAGTPYLTKLRSPSSALSSIFAISGQSIKGFVAPTKAAGTEEFSQCDDIDYKKYNLATDMFCNVRYGETGNALSADGEAIAKELIDTNQVDATTGAAIPDSDYAHYLESCVNRSDPIGGFSEETEGKPNAEGEDCIVKSSRKASNSSGLPWESSVTAAADLSKFSKFRIYTIDQSIIKNMEEDYPEFSGTTDTGGSNGGTTEPVVTMPPEAVVDGAGWSLPAGKDYSHYSCAEGLEEIDNFTNTGNGTTFKFCKFDTGKVTSIMSAIAVKIKADAKADNVDLSLTGPRTGVRSYEDQADLRRENGCPDVYTSPPSSCATPTARPGTSNHEFGTAFDWNTGSRYDTSSPQYKWLAANGAKYYLFVLKNPDGSINEAWHWSTNGG